MEFYEADRDTSSEIRRSEASATNYSRAFP